METIRHLLKILIFLVCLSSFGQNIKSEPAKNGVQLEQVGNGNIVSSQVTSRSSYLNISQVGDYNYLKSYQNTKELDHNIIQNGNNNKIFDFQFDPTQENKLNLIQNGNNTHFERHGTNSIGNKMEINMGGNTRTIILRNFK